MTPLRRTQFWMALALLGLALPVGAQIALQREVIAGGGGRSASAGGCIVLDATLGQAAAGVASAGIYSISSGYWAGIDAGGGDAIFNQGFEECR